MTSRLLRKYAWPDEAGLSRLKARMTRLNMSARAFDRILRVARTTADLYCSAALPAPDSPSYPAALAAAAVSPVKVGHIAEAIGYRSLDRDNYGKIY